MVIFAANKRHLTEKVTEHKQVPKKYEPRQGISDYVVCANSKDPDQPAHTRRQIRAFASRYGIL